MKRKLCRMSRGRNASARGRGRSSGQILRATTIAHAMKLNAMLRKNRIICCGMMNIPLLEFQPLTVAGHGDRVAPRRRGFDVVGNSVLTLPDFGVRRELRRGREGTTQFAIVSVEVKARFERGDHELRELANPVAKGPLLAGQRRITTSNRLEVLWGLAGHIEHVSRRCPQFESAALVVVNVVANATEHIDWITDHSCGLHEHPGRRRHDPYRSPNSPAD